MLLPDFVSGRESFRIALGVLLLTLAGSGLSAAEPIVVEMLDGSEVRGAVDFRTDEQCLWLRREAAGIQLCSGFPWEQVRKVRYDRQVHSWREFLAVAQRIKTPAKTFAQIAPFRRSDSPASPDGRRTPQAPRDTRDTRVQTLHVEAFLARWSRGQATDGLRVYVYPLNAAGELVPVDGQIEFTLFGEFENARGGEATVLSPEFCELDEMSELVRAGDFAHGAAVYAFPFRRFHPDVNFDVSRQAVLHARLGIPGQGVFEASDAWTRLRDFSRIRDQLQLYTQRRFFPGENALPLPR